MASLTDLTMAEAREGLAKRSFSAHELTAAHVKAVETARPLNAFITETPELALAQAAASDKRLARGEARAARRTAARHQGSVLHQGHPHHRRLAHPRRLQAAL